MRCTTIVQQKPIPEEEKTPGISRERHDRLLGAAIAVLIAIIFVTDSVTPLSLVVWVLYFLPLFLTVYLRDRFASVYVACAVVILSLIGIFPGPKDVPLANALVNRLFFSVVIAVVTYLIVNYRKNVDALDESREELRKAHGLLESHMNNSPLAIVEFDEKFRITRWTGEAEKTFGWTAGEVVGKAIGEFPWVYEADVPRVTAISADMLAGKSGSNMHANRNYTKDGSVIECEWYNSAIRGADGRLVSIFSQVLDVTDRNRAEAEIQEKNTELAAANEELTVSQEELLQNMDELARGEQALRASEERYRSLFLAMTEGFSLDEVIFDDAGKPVNVRYLAVNPAFERQRGLPADKMVGRTATELFPGVEPVWFERYGEVVRTGSPARFEEKFGPLDRWFDVSAYRTGQNQLAAVFTDITERRKAEERQHLMQEILRVLNAGGELHGTIREILRYIRDATGFDAVGLRLRKGEEFPYFEQNGFPEAFLKEEDFLCARHGDGSITRNADGSAVLECTCGLILSGRTDPSLPCFTGNGSFATCTPPG